MKRIPELDALRGIALLGILLVNAFVFHAPLCFFSEFYGSFEGLQAITVEAVVNLAAGKFLFIFAFLFGYAIAIQQDLYRDAFKAYFVRRMAVLFVLGVLHILLFWIGDILASYAVLGLLVLPLLRFSDNSILALGILFWFFRPLYFLGVVSLDWPEVQAGKPVELEQFIAVFQQGSYFEIFQLRMREYAAFLHENLVWFLPKTFGLLLIGIYASRKTLHDRIRVANGKYLSLSLVLIAIGVSWFYGRSTVFGMVDMQTAPLMRPLMIAANVLFESILSLGYIFGLSVAFQKSERITGLFAKAGRLALTNYMMQSLICTSIFYGFGAGYFARLLPTDLVLISAAVFAVNVLLSVLYLRFMQVGPLEGLWRKIAGFGKAR